MSRLNNHLPLSVFIGNVHSVLRSFEKHWQNAGAVFSEDDWITRLEEHWNEVRKQEEEKLSKFLSKAEKVHLAEGDGVHSVPLEAGGEHLS